MLKRVEPAPAWLGALQVREVCALSGCSNACCLFDRAEDAVAALSAGRFANSEPGPFRVVAMSAVARPE